MVKELRLKLGNEIEYAINELDTLLDSEEIVEDYEIDVLSKKVDNFYDLYFKFFGEHYITLKERNEYKFENEQIDYGYIDNYNQRMSDFQ